MTAAEHQARRRGETAATAYRPPPSRQATASGATARRAGPHTWKTTLTSTVVALAAPARASGGSSAAEVPYCGGRTSASTASGQLATSTVTVMLPIQCIRSTGRSCPAPSRALTPTSWEKTTAARAVERNGGIRASTSSAW
ncbi:hypothetical protein ACR820_05015 [Streptomyces netropsis]